MEGWMKSKCIDLRKRFEDTVNNENFKANNSCESLTQAERDAQRATVIENEKNFSKSLKFWLFWARRKQWGDIKNPNRETSKSQQNWFSFSIGSKQQTRVFFGYNGGNSWKPV